MRYRLRIVKGFDYLLKTYFQRLIQDALRLPQRARAAIEAASLRACSVMLAARRFPPILPPLRPIWAMRCDTTDLVSWGSSGCPTGVSPVSLLTAMMPAWNSSLGLLRERFRIRYQRGMFWLRMSRTSGFKVAHYPTFGWAPLKRLTLLVYPIGGTLA